MRAEAPRGGFARVVSPSFTSSQRALSVDSHLSLIVRFYCFFCISPAPPREKQEETKKRPQTPLTVEVIEMNSPADSAIALIFSLSRKVETAASFDVVQTQIDRGL